MVTNIKTHHRARAGVMRRAALVCLLLALPALFTCHKVNLTAQPQAPSRPVIAAGVEVDDTGSVSVSTANDTLIVAVRLAWGDGDTTAWLPDSAGDSVAAAHVWYWSSAFVVRAQARNQWGVFSEWSEPCSVAVTGLPTFADSLIASTYVDSDAWQIVVRPDGEYCYVADHWHDSTCYLMVVRLADLAVTDSVALPGAATAVCCSPDGENLYVGAEAAWGDSDWVVKVRVQDNTVSMVTAIDNAPCALAVTPDNSQVWAADGDYARVLVLSASDLMPVDTFGVYYSPIAIAFDRTGAFAYVADLDAPGLAVIDVVGRRVTDAIRLESAGAWDMTYSAALDRICVVMPGDSSNYVLIDPDPRAVDFSFACYDPMFQSLAVADDGEWLYLATEEDAIIAVARPGENRIRAYIAAADSSGSWLTTYDLATLPDSRLIVLNEVGRLNLYGPSAGVGGARASYVGTLRAAR